MKIIEIYEKHKTSQFLQAHQFRVAGVCSILSENLNKNINKEIVISVGLLHDMANVLKFNFEIFPDEAFSPEGKDYWKQVKKEFQEKYGSDEHKATIQITKELGVHKRITEIISRMSFRNLPEIFSSNDWDLKACEYSDLRVSPSGVLSLKERLLEGRKRYVERAKTEYNSEVFDKSADYAYKLEKQIFEHCKIAPSDITDEKVNPLIEELRSFDITNN